MRRFRFRRFSAAVERIALAWTRDPIARADWRLGEPVAGQSESGARHAHCGNLAAIAKPCEPGLPRAAFEKIASDLAYRLGLPVPPVALWREGAGPFRALSLVCFAPSRTLDAAWPDLDAAQRRAAIRVASALHVFDAWLCAWDRGPHHLLVGPGRHPAFAAIDYGFAFAQLWRAGDAMESAPAWNYPFARDAKAAREMEERIGRLRPRSIASAIRGLPPSILLHGTAREIVAALRRPLSE